MRTDAAEAAKHYRTAFEHSQDPLVSILREVGGTVSGVRDTVTGFFTRRDSGDGGNGNGGDRDTADTDGA